MTHEMRNLPIEDSIRPEKAVDTVPNSLGLPFDQPDDAPRFDGETYDPTQDHQRLGKQALNIFHWMRWGRWLTLHTLSGATGYPEASISARMRDFRKKRFGAHTIERRRIGASGAWEYRLLVNPQARLDLLGIDEQK